MSEEPSGTGPGEFMHESLNKDAVAYDLPLEEIIDALARDNELLQRRYERLRKFLQANVAVAKASVDNRNYLVPLSIDEIEKILKEE